ncbi:MAG: hypothetical protein ACK55Z_23815 [bacterium]
MERPLVTGVSHRPVVIVSRQYCRVNLRRRSEPAVVGSKVDVAGPGSFSSVFLAKPASLVGICLSK